MLVALGLLGLLLGVGILVTWFRGSDVEEQVSTESEDAAVAAGMAPTPQRNGRTDAEILRNAEYGRIRVRYNELQKMGDWQRAKDEMERVLMLIPDPADERHQFARRKIHALRAKISESGE